MQETMQGRLKTDLVCAYPRTSHAPGRAWQSRARGSARPSPAAGSGSRQACRRARAPVRRREGQAAVQIGPEIPRGDADCVPEEQ